MHKPPRVHALALLLTTLSVRAVYALIHEKGMCFTYCLEMDGFTSCALLACHRECYHDFASQAALYFSKIRGAERHQLTLQMDPQAQKEVEALRAAVTTQGREREVAAQAQARLAAAKKQMKELEWSSEVFYSILGLHHSACMLGSCASCHGVRTGLDASHHSGTTGVPVVCDSCHQVFGMSMDTPHDQLWRNPGMCIWFCTAVCTVHELLQQPTWNIAQVQLQRLEQVQAEHDDLAARFEAAVTEARQAAGAEGLLAERRAGELGQALAQREAELQAAHASAGPAGAASAKAAGQQCEKVREAEKVMSCCVTCMAVRVAGHEHRGHVGPLRQERFGVGAP